MRKAGLPILMTWLLGLITVGVTVAIYNLLGTEHTPIQQLAIKFMVLAELLVTFGISLMFLLPKNTNRTFANAGGISVLVIFMTATLVTCLVASTFGMPRNVFLSIQVILLLVTTGAYLLVLYLGYSVGAKDTAVMTSQAGMLMCERRLYALTTDAKQRSYYSALNKLYERVRFADRSAVPEHDGAIVTELERLENLVQTDGEKEKVLSSITALESLLQKRGHVQLQSKRGGF